MNRTLLISLAMIVAPTTAMAARAPSSPQAGTGERELVDGRIVAPAHPHAWRASAVTARQARSWSTLSHELGDAWATWDDGAQAPRQIIGAGLAAPGTVASAAEAERVARAFVERHLELLAPGASPGDFVVVANHLSSEIRSVGLAQRSAGRDVVGGQIGVMFKHDRLVMVQNQAQPFAHLPATSARVSDTDARDHARAWIDGDFAPAGVSMRGAVEGPFILPVGDASTGPRYRQVVRVDVATEAPRGRYWVYLDAQTGEAVARESRIHHATGRVLYNAPLRSPLSDYSLYPTPFTEHVVNGAPAQSDGAGVFTFTGPNATVAPGLQGPFVRILNEAGPLATTSLPVADGGAASWNLASDPMGDAQLSVYVHLLQAKAHTRAIDPNLAWLDGTMTANVNIEDECNAMSDGDSVYFLQGGGTCENTGRISDVIYHEFGHSVHHQSIIPGVGAFDGALSEGIADFLAATMVNDSGMARGFFYNDEPLRELNPDGYEWTWPQDNGEIHYAGQIIGGTLWDLRTLLIEKYGPEQGVAVVDRIHYEATRRAVDMPTMYGAALLVDDDDGNLANGTPNGCEINLAFGRHGLFSGVEGVGEQVYAEEDADGLRVRADLSLPSFDACPIEATAVIEWGPRDGDSSTQIAEMTPTEGGFGALLPPLPPGQVMRYRVLVSYNNGAERAVPTNLGDPWFQHWFGEVEPIYCTSFEDGDAAGWDLDGEWSVGSPAGLGGDPGEAAGADPLVLGHDLTVDGLYTPWTTSVTYSPVIEIPRAYESVRLHYQRWLTVEDGFYDQAWIDADDIPVWRNYASDIDYLASVHHRDAQWVFHDVDLTEQAADGLLQLGFGHSSDGGLEMGGWTIDEVCVVGFGPRDGSTCGNGLLEGGEQCDDGNTAEGDGCSSQCLFDGTQPGDDDDDDDDDSPGLDPEQIPGDGRLIDRGCTCRADDSGDLPLPFGAMILLLLGLRRRRA